MKCEAAAQTLSRRTDDEGRHIFLRCHGAAAELKNAENLSTVRDLMANDVKDVLADANITLSKRRDKYNKYFQNDDDGLQKLELRNILDRQNARVEKVEQAWNWRRDLVRDLRDMFPVVSEPSLKTRSQCLHGLGFGECDRMQHVLDVGCSHNSRKWLIFQFLL